MIAVDWPITAMNPRSIVRLTPGLWAQECKHCGDGITGSDVGAVNSALAVHVWRNHNVNDLDAGKEK